MLLKPLEVEALIEDALLDDTALQAVVGGRVFRYVAPMAAPMPFVVLSIQSARDELGIGAAVILTTYDVVVRAVGNPEDLANLQTAADRFDAVLISGLGQSYQIARRAPVTYVTVENNQYYRHLGARYQVDG